jgi:hypothetical protein
MYSDLKRRNTFERSVVSVPFQIFLWSRHTFFCAYLNPFVLPGLRQEVNVIIPLSFLNIYLLSASSFFFTSSRILFCDAILLLFM